MKNSVSSLGNWMDGTEERNSELEDRIIEAIQSEKQRKINWKKKVSRTLRTCGSIMKYVVFMS